VRFNVKRHLSPDSVFLDLKADNKEDIIKEMIERLNAAGKIEDKESALKAIFEREKKMTTGMEHGIAIPHGKTDTVKGLVAAVALKKGGVDFDSMDKKPAKIIIMTVSPASQSGPHIQFLAEVSKLLKNEKAREQLLQSETVDQILNFFS
jgi:fructose-specific phosphotransferase system IIA component